MKILKYFLLLFELIEVITGTSRMEGCLLSNRPHQTECNKYFKCVKMADNKLVWLPLTCQDGLIYDESLKSCVIPKFDWECTKTEEYQDNSGDQKNLIQDHYLEILEDRVGQQTERNSESPIFYDDSLLDKSEEDGFIEVIDGEANLATPIDRQNARVIDISREVEDEPDYSGDGNTKWEEITTPSVAITTHLQRITQLMNDVWTKAEMKNESTTDLMPSDLNSFLAKENIQLGVSSYQNSGTKKPLPTTGLIHPEIMSEILRKQHTLNKNVPTIPTTLPMQTTPSSTQSYNQLNQDVDTETEIKMTNPDKHGAHQIFVNRPEGSVMFNVPMQNSNKNRVPYLSDEILRTVLELSKQLASTKTYVPQPVYYPVPFQMTMHQDDQKVKNAAVNNQPINSPKPTETIFYNHYNQPQVYQDRYGPLMEFANHQNTYGSLSNKSKESNGNFLKGTPYLNRYGNFQGYYQPAVSDQSFLQSQYYPQIYGGQNFKNNYEKNYELIDSSNLRGRPQPATRFRPPNNQQSSIIEYEEDEPIEYEESGSIVTDLSSPYLDQIEHNRRTNKKPLKESFTFESQDTENNDDEGEGEGEHIEDMNEEDYDDKLVNVAGSYFNLKNFKKNLLPLLKNDENIDVIDCSIGNRQPNMTDCKKYYVCNPKSKHVVSYTCPLFTAFNENTRVCDSKSYSTCNSKFQTKGNIDENKRIHMETLKALAQAKSEALKAQKIANMLRKQSQLFMQHQHEATKEPEYKPTKKPTVIRESVKVEPPSTAKTPSRRKQSDKTKKKKRPKCREPGKIADPNSPKNYYLCFLDRENKSLQRKKIACSKGLIYCRQAKFCTLQSKCNFD